MQQQAATAADVGATYTLTFLFELQFARKNKQKKARGGTRQPVARDSQLAARGSRLAARGSWLVARGSRFVVRG